MRHPMYDDELDGPHVPTQAEIAVRRLAALPRACATAEEFARSLASMNLAAFMSVDEAFRGIGRGEVPTGRPNG